jgi:hypothetical protein
VLGGRVQHAEAELTGTVQGQVGLNTVNAKP